MPNIIGYDQYAARGISPALLIGLIKKVGGANASSLVSKDITIPTADEVHALAAHLLANEEGERFSVGDYDLIVLRFVCDGCPYSIVSVEGYPSPYPALVDGHLIDRDSAITAWLGEGSAEEHPDLYLAPLK